MHVNLQSSVSSEGDRRRLVVPSSVSRPQFHSGGKPHRVIALAWLSERVPDRFLAERLAERIHQETGRSVGLLNLSLDKASNGAVVHVNGHGDTEAMLRSGWGWVNKESRLSGYLRGLEGPVGQFRVQLTAEEAEAGAFSAMVTQLRERFHYILLNVPSDAPCALLLESLVQADRGFLFVQATSHDLYHRELLLRVVRGHPQRDRMHLKTIICREQGEG